jgi:hypothetical protein
MLRALELCDAGVAFRAGESGARVAVSAKHGGDECGQTGRVRRAARETALSHRLSAGRLALEIVEVHWDERVSVDVPNDTATHRARNLIRAYDHMPGGRHLKLELPLARLAAPTAADGASVELTLGDAAAARWQHNPHRLYGPWGERERGPFVPVAAPALATRIILTFDEALGAAAFVRELALARAPKAKAAAGAAGAASGENGDPQAPPNPLLPLHGLSFVFTGSDGADCRVSREAAVGQLGGRVTSAVSGKTTYLVAYARDTKKYREADQRRRDGRPGPTIVDEAGVDAVLERAAATRRAAAAKHAAASGPSDEPDAKRQCA